MYSIVFFANIWIGFLSQNISVNEKKNAVATKITDTAVATLETNIDEQYIALIVSRLFDSQKTAVENLKQEELVDTILSKLNQAKDNVDHMQDTQPLFERLSFSGSQALQSVSQAAAQLKQAKKTKVEERKKAYVSQVTDQ